MRVAKSPLFVKTERLPEPTLLIQLSNMGTKRKAETTQNGHFSPEKKVVENDGDIVENSLADTGDVVDENEEEINGMEEDEETVPAPRPHHLTKKQKKQLTAQEIQLARETAELFKSNIFKLQIDELMKEVKIKDSNVQKIEKVLHKLHQLIKLIPETESLSLLQSESLFNKKISIPFPDPKPTNVNYSFQYKSPQDINLIGSFGLKTGINTSSSIDMALTMPSSLFQPKDYLNYRALNKRAFYLAYIADKLISLLKKNNLPIKLSYIYLNDDILCPIIKIESIQTDNSDDLHFFKTKFTINLIVSFPFGIFDLKKILPDKNCIRVQTDSETLPPTPIYNASIISQTSYDYYLKYLYTVKKSVDSFKDACIMGRLWLQQRGFTSEFNHGGFGHFEWAVLMSALLNGGGKNGNKVLLNGFSSYQLFKGTVKYLATMDLTENGYLSFSSLVGENIPSKYNDEGFNVPTIFDKNTKLNVLWKMTKFSCKRLQKFAKDSLVLLNDLVKDRFDVILLKKANIIHLKYDLVFNLTIPQEIYELFGPLEKITFISFDNFIKHKLSSIVTTGLNDRINNIDIWNENPSNKFPIHKRKPSNVANNFFIGLSLNPDQCDKLVTKGPNNDEEQAGLKFKTFWGSNASLRRFKDGSIQHCVVWSPVNNEPIAFTIVKHCLDSHLLPNISQHLYAENSKFNAMLPVPLTGNQGNSTATFSALKNSFDELAKLLTTLDLPLGVKSLSPASPALRYTSLLQPVPFATSNPDFWNECVVQFETSTRWPDEISSLEKTKTAFLLKIQETLANETSYESFMTIDDSIPFNEHISLLNILTPEGYGFKLRVLTERDEMMYLRAVSNADKNKSIVQDIYLKFNQKYVGSLKHTRTVSQLSHHYQYYSSTVRLFKLWLDSQLLLQHFNDELVELIALKPFVESAPYFTPNSTENGFLQILNFLANWNWKEESLILDLVKQNDIDGDEDFSHKFSDKLTIPAYQLIESNFEKIRKSDPSGIKTQFFIGSKDDPSGILWCNELTLPIATRLTALSRAAMQLIKTNGVTESSIESMFTPALNDYDFIINVKGQNLTSSSGILPANTFKNLINLPTSFPEDITSKYDLIQSYLDELNNKFGNIIIFSTKKFTGLSKDGSNVISGIFVPTFLSKKKFKVNLNYNFNLVDKSDEVIINKEAIFDQITLLGGELIQSVDRN